MNVLIPRRFEQGFRVGAVRLCCVAHVGWQQPNHMAELFELARPVMRRAARLKQHGRRRLLRQVRKESVARQAFLCVDAPRSM